MKHTVPPGTKFFQSRDGWTAITPEFAAEIQSGQYREIPYWSVLCRVRDQLRPRQDNQPNLFVDRPVTAM